MSAPAVAPCSADPASLRPTGPLLPILLAPGGPSLLPGDTGLGPTGSSPTARVASCAPRLPGRARGHGERAPPPRLAVSSCALAPRATLPAPARPRVTALTARPALQPPPSSARPPLPTRLPGPVGVARCAAAEVPAGPAAAADGYGNEPLCLARSARNPSILFAISPRISEPGSAGCPRGEREPDKRAPRLPPLCQIAGRRAPARPASAPAPPPPSGPRGPLPPAARTPRAQPARGRGCNARSVHRNLPRRLVHFFKICFSFLFVCACDLKKKSVPFPPLAKDFLPLCTAHGDEKQMSELD